MSDSSSSSRTEEEILSSRGFSSNLITLRGFTSYGYRDRSRDVLSAVDVWDLQLRILIKDKAWRNHILYDYPEDRIPVLGSNRQVMMLDKASHMYDDTELLYLPLRLTGKRYHHVPETELDIFEQESREEGIYWFGEIPGKTPVSELLEKVSPNMLNACHILQENQDLNEKSSSINNDPHNFENIEIFFKPFRNAAGHCWKIDCPLCRPVEKFLEAHRRANKKAKNWLLVGLRLDDKESVRYDNLKSLQELMKIASTAFNVFNLNSSIWDTWSRLDNGELDN